MAVSGMTGFGRAEGAFGAARWIWEAKSVNGRGLDVKLRLPPGFDALEPLVRDAAAKRFRRGSIQASLTLQRDAGNGGARIDLAFVESLIEASKPYVAAGHAAPPRWDGLLALRGAFAGEEEAPDPEQRAALEADLARGAAEALDLLADARRAEGRTLAGVLNAMMERAEALVQAARTEASDAPAAQAGRLKARLAALAPEIVIDPQRLAQEAALIAARADVAEELERLSAHVAEARAMLSTPEPAGRRLDFLSQELTREANTLCAKSSELSLTRIGLDLKAVIDQFKEQAANVE